VSKFSNEERERDEKSEKEIHLTKKDEQIVKGKKSDFFLFFQRLFCFCQDSFRPVVNFINILCLHFALIFWLQKLQS